MNSIRRNWRKLIFFFNFLLTPVISFAYTAPCTPGSGKICNPISQNTVTGFIETLLKGVIRIGIPIVALAIIYCGFLFVSARGNSEKLSKAKDALLYTIIGAAILLGAYAIAILISETVTSL